MATYYYAIPSDADRKETDTRNLATLLIESRQRHWLSGRMPNRILIAYVIIAVVLFAFAIAAWVTARRRREVQHIIRGYRDWGRSSEKLNKGGDQ